MASSQIKPEEEEGEEGCFATTFERKYYAVDGHFKKHSLRPDEFKWSAYRSVYHVPRVINERLWNEAAALRYIKAHADIPVPELYSAREENGAVILDMQYVEGVDMIDLDETQRRHVRAELDRHLATMHALRSHRVGGPSGIVIPPYRVMNITSRDAWSPADDDEADDAAEPLVFCHNDLSMHNVIVDPETLKVNAIIDWEYAGFWPVSFERRFFERKGPSVALEGEEDDAPALLEWLEARDEEPRVAAQ